MTETAAINSQDYDTYATVAQAEVYLEAASHATTWQAETDETVKARAIVTATRTLDRQSWKGSKNAADQPLAWPRAETGIDGVEDAVVPTDIVNACIELALAILDGSEVQNQGKVEDRVRSMQAGSVSLTYARSVAEATRFPLIVQELLNPYLSGGSSTLVGQAVGVDEETIFPIEVGYNTGGIS